MQILSTTFPSFQFVNAGDKFTVIGRSPIVTPRKKGPHDWEWVDGWIDGRTIVEAMRQTVEVQTGSVSAEWPLGKPLTVIVQIKSHDGVVFDGGWIRAENLMPSNQANSFFLDMILPDTDFLGGDLDVGGYLGRVKGNKVSLHDCAQACMAIPACRGVTWVREENVLDNCALKTTHSHGRERDSTCCVSMDMHWISARVKNSNLIDGLWNASPVSERFFLRAFAFSCRLRTIKNRSRSRLVVMRSVHAAVICINGSLLVVPAGKEWLGLALPPSPHFVWSPFLQASACGCRCVLQNLYLLQSHG